MGTRGAYGFRYKKKDYLIYNHYDSYPSGLGANVIEFVRRSLTTEGDIKKTKTLLESSVKLDKLSFRPELLGCFGDYIDPTITLGSIKNDFLYQIGLPHALDSMLESGYFKETSNHFIYDSLFCEYAYIVNLDTGKLEFYTGFNTTNNTSGRYIKDTKTFNNLIADGSINGTEYKPCKFKKSWKLYDVIDSIYDGVQGEMERLCGD